MRIAVWHNLGSGGGKRALYNHVKALKDAGHYLEAWTTDYSSDEYLLLSELITEHRKEFKARYDKIHTIKNALRREQYLNRILTEVYKECAREIESGGFDIVFANSCGITYMPYIGLYTKLPGILYLGEPYRPLYEAMPENIWKAPYPSLQLKKIKRLIRDYFVNYALRLRVLNEILAAKSYSKILVNSLFSRESVIRAYGVDASVCYLGVDTEFFKSDTNVKEPYVIGLGTISKIKSVDKAVEIIARIDEAKRPPLKWIANGFDKEYLNHVETLAKRLNVDFHPYINITDGELVDIVGRAAIMIYTPTLEPFGLAPLEGNSCGTFVVALAEGGVRESIQNRINGILINGLKPDEFADVISVFVNDLDFAILKGKEARSFVVNNWNDENMALNIVNEFNTMFLSHIPEV